MSPEAVTAAGMGVIAVIDRLPEVLRIIAGDRKDKRKAKDGGEAK